MVLTFKTDDLVLYLMDESVLKNLQESSFCSAEHEKLKEIFAILTQGVIDVINKQMGAYLGGELATLSPSKCYHSKSAPVHNIFAQEHLVYSW